MPPEPPLHPGERRNPATHPDVFMHGTSGGMKSWGLPYFNKGEQHLESMFVTSITRNNERPNDRYTVCVYRIK